VQDYTHAVQDAEARRAPVAMALQAMRGVALVVAVTVVAEVGDFRRFANPRQLMAYLGLVPSEHSSGGSIWRAGITKAGNTLARRVLIEGAWTYRMPARVSRTPPTAGFSHMSLAENELGRLAGLEGRIRTGYQFT
jgi:transposase